jgi:hypothetical protein
MSNLSPTILIKSLKYHRHECWGADKYAYTLVPNPNPTNSWSSGCPWWELAIRNQKFTVQSALFVMDKMSGWVYHTRDDGRYFFTTPDGRSVSFSTTELRNVALGLLLTWQQSPEYVKVFTAYFESKLEGEAAWGKKYPATDIPRVVE